MLRNSGDDGSKTDIEFFTRTVLNHLKLVWELDRNVFVKRLVNGSGITGRLFFEKCAVGDAIFIGDEENIEKLLEANAEVKKIVDAAEAENVKTLVDMHRILQRELDKKQFELTVWQTTQEKLLPQKTDKPNAINQLLAEMAEKIEEAKHKILGLNNAKKVVEELEKKKTSRFDVHREIHKYLAREKESINLNADRQRQIERAFNIDFFQRIALDVIHKMPLMLTLDTVSHIKKNLVAPMLRYLQANPEWKKFWSEKLIYACSKDKNNPQYAYATDDTDGELLLDAIGGTLCYRLISAAGAKLVLNPSTQTRQPQLDLNDPVIKEKYMLITKILNTLGKPEVVLHLISSEYVSTTITSQFNPENITNYLKVRPEQEAARVLHNLETYVSLLKQSFDFTVNHPQFKLLSDAGKILLNAALIHFLHNIARFEAADPALQKKVLSDIAGVLLEQLKAYYFFKNDLALDVWKSALTATLCALDYYADDHNKFKKLKKYLEHKCLTSQTPSEEAPAEKKSEARMERSKSARFNIADEKESWKQRLSKVISPPRTVTSRDSAPVATSKRATSTSPTREVTINPSAVKPQAPLSARDHRSSSPFFTNRLSQSARELCVDESAKKEMEKIMSGLRNMSRK